jgi:hypothetical protein
MSIAYILFASIDYSNFKGVIARTEDQCDKLGTYTRFHAEMEDWQNAPRSLDWEPSCKF